RKRERIDGRDHDVPVSVYDQRRLGDPLELAKAFSSDFPPFSDRRQLCLHRLRGAGRVDVLPAKMASFPEGPAGGLAARRRGKEQIEEGFEPSFTCPRIGRRSILGVLRIGRRLTRARSGAYQHETLHERRMPEREYLGNVAADRKSEDIYVRKAEGT